MKPTSLLVLAFSGCLATADLEDPGSVDKQAPLAPSPSTAAAPSTTPTTPGSPGAPATPTTPATPTAPPASPGLPMPDGDGVIAAYGAFGPTGCRSDINWWHPTFNATGPGTYTVSTQGDAIRVVNTSSSYLQLNAVTAVGDFAGQVGELAVNMDMDVARTYAPYESDGSTHVELHPYQPWMGVGEVADALRVDPSQPFRTIRWSAFPQEATPTGLSVPPGSCVVISGHTYFPGSTTSTMMPQFQIELAVQQRGLVVVRQPQIDKINICNGADQYTPAQPWRNTTGRTLYVKGATLSTGTPTGDSVLSACVQIFGTDNLPRRRICSGPGGDVEAAVATQGEVDWPAEAVYPNEQVVYQARHSCEAGGYWGSTAYLHMF